jgi:hypothetical protein
LKQNFFFKKRRNQFWVKKKQKKHVKKTKANTKKKPAGVKIPRVLEFFNTIFEIISKKYVSNLNTIGCELKSTGPQSSSFKLELLRAGPSFLSIVKWIHGISFFH